MYASIYKRTISGYDESGEWLEGDVREISNDGQVDVEPDEFDIEDYGGAIEYLVDYIRKLGAFEASVSSIGDSVREHCWLTATYVHPYHDNEEVTTVRIHECTDAERAEIFRRVTE